MTVVEFVAEHAEYAGGSGGDVVVRIDGRAHAPHRMLLGQPTLIVTGAEGPHRVEPIARQTPAFVEVGPEGAGWTAAFSLPARLAVAATEWWLEPGPQLDDNVILAAAAGPPTPAPAPEPRAPMPEPRSPTPSPPPSLPPEPAPGSSSQPAAEAPPSGSANVLEHLVRLEERVDRLEDRLDRLLFALAGLEREQAPRRKGILGRG